MNKIYRPVTLFRTQAVFNIIFAFILAFITGVIVVIFFRIIFIPIVFLSIVIPYLLNSWRKFNYAFSQIKIDEKGLFRKAILGTMYLSWKSISEIIIYDYRTLFTGRTVIDSMEIKTFGKKSLITDSWLENYEYFRETIFDNVSIEPKYIEILFSDRFRLKGKDDRRLFPKGFEK